MLRPDAGTNPVSGRAAACWPGPVLRDTMALDARGFLSSTWRTLRTDATSGYRGTQPRRRGCSTMGVRQPHASMELLRIVAATLSMFIAVKPHRRVRLVACCLSATAWGCSSDATSPPPPVALRVGPPNGQPGLYITTGQIATLIARPVSADSTVLSGPVQASWSSSDTSLVRVTQDGIVTAGQRAGRVTVTAEATVSGRQLGGAVPVVVVIPQG
jgi:hypothetical protein